MIRNSSTIFGEPNDPDTVLASSELTLAKLIVGAGNKGCKSFAPGAKRIITTDQYGNASSSTYDVANKYVGTDEYGQLVMKDAPEVTILSQFTDITDLPVNPITNQVCIVNDPTDFKVYVYNGTSWVVYPTVI